MATKPLHPEAKLLTAEQAGELLGICKASVFTLIKRGDIASLKVGGARRIVRSDLDAFIARNAEGGAL